MLGEKVTAVLSIDMYSNLVCCTFIMNKFVEKQEKPRAYNEIPD